jgi:hypothetical protein
VISGNLWLQYCCSHQQLLHKTQRKWCQYLEEWWQSLWLHSFFFKEKKKMKCNVYPTSYYLGSPMPPIFHHKLPQSNHSVFHPYISNWCLMHSTTLQTYIVFSISWNLTIHFCSSHHFCDITINTKLKRWVTTHYFIPAELNTQLEIVKHEPYPLLVGRWFYTQWTLPSLYLQSAVFSCAKFRQNAKNKYKKGVFCHNILFFWGKSPNLREIFLNLVLQHLHSDFDSILKISFKNI